MAIEAISAVTLATRDMGAAIRFYTTLGFDVRYGGDDAHFTSLSAGPSQYLNLLLAQHVPRWTWWGRVIFYVSDVDAMYEHIREAGFEPETAPRDAEWGERYFHILDPDGHEISLARPIDPGLPLE